MDWNHISCSRNKKKQGKDEQIAMYLPSLLLPEVLTWETLLPVFERPLVVVSIATVNWS